MFWFCFGISAYWFIFYKFQYKVFILLPQYDNWKENYASFDVINNFYIEVISKYLINRYKKKKIKNFYPFIFNINNTLILNN